MIPCGQADYDEKIGRIYGAEECKFSCIQADWGEKFGRAVWRRRE